MGTVLEARGLEIVGKGSGMESEREIVCVSESEWDSLVELIVV
jgi:hypothetical protein